MAGTQTPISNLPATLQQGQVPNAKIENRLRKMVGNVRGRNGITVTIGPDGGLVIGGVDRFSGKVWVGGQRYTGIQNEGYNTDPKKPWVKVVLGQTIGPESISEVLGPPAMPVPDNEVWFEKSATFGDARVDRVG